MTRLEVTGNPVPLVEGVVVSSTGRADFDISGTGTLVYIAASGGAQRSLVWVDRDGREEPIEAPPRTYTYARLSPDGRRVALDVRDQNNDIWIYDLTSEGLTRLRALQCGTLKYVLVPISRFRVHETSIKSSGRLPVERDAILKRHAKNGRARLRAIWRRHLSG